MGTTTDDRASGWRGLEEIAHRIQGGADESYRDFALFLMAALPRWFVSRGVPEADAEDLVIECIIKCRAALDSYTSRPGVGIQAWIFEIARHLAADFFERFNAESVLLEELSPNRMPVSQTDNLRELFGETDTPDPAVVGAVNDSLAKLSEIDQEIIHFRYFAQMADVERTFESIGHILGIPEGTARQRHNRAVKRLEAILVSDSRIKLRGVILRP